jgi:large subunit ribosomal protein L25
MQTVKLKAESRVNTGKGVARKLRAEGRIPAVFYGRGVETRSLVVSPKSLREAVSGELGINSVIELDIDGQSVNVLIADFQLHPVTRDVLHADFISVDETRSIEIEVPLELTGKAKGIVLGGKLRQVYRTLPVTCLPGQIPAKIAFDVSNLDVEEMVRAADLRLPEGVRVRLKPTQTVGGVYGRRGSQKEEEEAEAAAAAAPGKK